jgi:hypothetical protein
MHENLSYDLDGLAVDVFGLTESAGAVESLTGHGMADLSASCNCCSMSACSGSCGAEV